MTIKRSKILRFSELNMPRVRPDVLICLILIIAVILVYRPVQQYNFILFDDGAYVFDNPSVKEGLSLSGMAWAIKSAHASNWHPVTWLSHMLDVSLFGLNSGRHHMINVLIHIVNSILLLLVLRRMTGKLWLSGFVAALFAVHPINVESVAWIAERKNLLCTFFGLFTLRAYIRYIEYPNIPRYLSIILFFVLGLMTKPMLVTLPFLFLLLDYWPLGRIRHQQEDKIVTGQYGISEFLRLVKEKIPLFVLSGASSIVTYLVQQSSGAVKSLEVYPLNIRIENSLVSYARYLIKTIWPHNLSVIYPYPKSIPVWEICGALLLFVALSWLAIRTIRSYPFIAVGWFWYLGTLVPVIGLVQVGPQAMADRYAYIPVIGLFIAAAWGGFRIFLQLRLHKATIAVSAGALLLIMTVISCYQVRHWKDSISLFQHAVDVTSYNYIAHHNLALALGEMNRVDEAILQFKKALSIEPSFPTAHNNLGTALSKRGRLSEAMHHFSEALRLKPDYSGALYNLGNALAAEGRLNEAIDRYYQALAITPTDAEIHNNLGNALFNLDKVAAARDHYDKAISLQPSFVPALLNIAKSHASVGEYETARLFFKRVIHLKPDAPETYYYMAVTHARQNRSVESVEWLRRAVQKGFNNWEFLKTDRQLDNIRESSDYRKFIENHDGRNIRTTQ